MTRQRTDELCAAAMRALSGEPDLHLRGRIPHHDRGRVPVHAPHLGPPESDDLASLRGVVDGISLRLKHSDAQLHRKLAPADPVERLVFEILEQFRAESLAPQRMPGVVRNLRHRHEQWSLEFHRSGLTETSRGLVLYAMAQMCRSRVTGQPVVAETEDLIEATRFALAPRLGTALAGLRAHRHDQAAYADHALAVAQVIGELVVGEDDPADGEETDRGRFALLLDQDDDSADAVPKATTGRSRVLDGEAGGYRAFTTAYDREHQVSALVRPALLKEYRERLDKLVAQHPVNVGMLGRAMRALLAEPAHDGWDGGREEGHVDGRRLAQLVASPTEFRLFRQERVEPVTDCVVTVLVDCSGSMKQHAESVAVIVDVLARALELAGASSEVLGFTTGAWNGGRAMRDWRRAGRPANPGRLNELCHLVFKDAGTPWRRARPGIAGLLKSDLFREGVDGEAVRWACRRLEEREESRRLLVVVSDGSPLDSATALTNDRHYLDDHLRDVVRREESGGSVRICGLGVGLDLSPFYRRSHVLDLDRGTGNRVFHEILGMIAGP